MNISENGIRTNQEKTRAISEWPRPRNLKELRSFLGVGSYYRKFIKGYSTLVSPLTLLTKSGEGKGRISKRRSRRINLEWNDECEVAMKSLKSKIIEAPVLSLPKYGFPFILETDASDVGLGAVLSQRIDGKLRTIAFASRTLSTGEKNKANFSSKKLEFIAIVWAVSDKFRHYLMGSKCTVYTDNSAVAYISRKGELTALEQRWVARLAPFDLDIKYRAGSLNQVSDALSRKRSSEVEGEDIMILYEDDLEVTEVKVVQDISKEELRKYQLEERDLSKIIGELESGHPKGHYRIIDGILYMGRENGNDVLVVPRVMIKEILVGLHDKNGHQGIDRTVSLINSRYTWKGRYKDVKEYILKCEVCQISKQGRIPRVEMGSLVASRSLELVFLDFVGLDKASDGRDGVLVITDAYTKLAKAVPTRNQLAVTVAKILMNDWIFCYGIPLRIHTDQGRNFQSEVVREICKLFGIRQSRTSPYQPEGNGQCERMNRSIITMLRTLCSEDKSQWPIHLPKLIHAYNCTPHKTTGFSPFFLMFGREENLPVDTQMGLSRRNVESDWVWETSKKMGEINRRVLKLLGETNRGKEESRDDLEVGCEVLVKNRVLGRRKLANIWGDVSWTVESKVRDTSAYMIMRGGLKRVENRRNLRKVTFK